MNIRGWNNLLLSLSCYLAGTSGSVAVQAGASRDEWLASVSRPCQVVGQGGASVPFSNNYSLLGELHKLAVCSSMNRPGKRWCRIRKGRVRCTGKLPCPPVWKKIGSVCSSDGRTYPSLCQMLRHDCRIGYGINLKDLGLWKVDTKHRPDLMMPSHLPPVMTNRLPQDPLPLDHSPVRWTSRGDMIAKLFRSKVREYVRKHNLPHRNMTGRK